MKMKKIFLLLIGLHSFYTLGYEGNLNNVYSVLEEFNLQVGTNKINEKLVFTYAVKASNALSKDWATVNKKSASEELLRLWEGKSELNALDAVGLLKSTRFKLEIAGYLGVGIDHCFIAYDKNALRFFVINYIEDSNARIQIAAIRNIGFVGNNQDIDYLSKVVEKQLEGWSQHAARSLDLIGTKESIEALLEVRKKITDEELLKFIIPIADQYTSGIKLAPECNQENIQ